MSEALSIPEKAKPEVFGRYVLYAPIARGGMATVHIARLVGDEGFSRIVAVKRLYPQFTEDQDFLTMFLDEARIASKIHHPNVVPVLDVVVSGKEAILVQEYVHGVPLDHLFKAAREQKTGIPVRVAVAVATGILSGLHAVHDARDEVGAPLGIVHRDVSPQNIIVSLDGTPRLVDFGIAKSTASEHVTRQGLFKGKLAYMSPEQLRGEAPARTTDLYAMGVLLWELVTGRRLHTGRNEAEVFTAVLDGNAPPITVALSDARASIPDERWAALKALEPVVARALSPNVAERYASAAEMLDALLRAVAPATPIAVAEWVRALGANFLSGRDKLLAANEASWRRDSSLAASQRLPPASGIVSGMHTSSRLSAMPSDPPPSTKRSADEAAVSGAVIAPPPPQRHVVRGLVAAVLLLAGVVVGVLLVRPGASPAPAAVTPPSGEPALAVQGALAAPVAATAPAAAAPAANANSGNAPSNAAANAAAANGAAPNAAAANVAAANVAAANNANGGGAAPNVAAANNAPNVAAANNVNGGGVAANNAAKTAEAARRAFPVAPPRAAPHPAAPAVHTSAPTSASPPAQPDCDPPFYFEGSKKVYKNGCL